MDFGEYRLDKDEHNYIVQKSMTRGEKSKKPGEAYYKDLAFFPINSLDLALMNILHRKIHRADMDEITFVINEIRSAREEIVNAIKATA